MKKRFRGRQYRLYLRLLSYSQEFDLCEVYIKEKPSFGESPGPFSDLVHKEEQLLSY